MSFIKTSNMDKYCYRKGDIVKLSNECLKSIGRKRIFSQNLFYIKDMDGLFANVSSDDVDVKIPIRDILPVKINSIEDRDIYYDPVVAASVIGAGQETPPEFKTMLYLRSLKLSFNISFGKHKHNRTSMRTMTYLFIIIHLFSQRLQFLNVIIIICLYS